MKKQTLVPCNGCAQLHYYQNRYLIVWQMNGSGMAQDARSIGNASGVTIYYGNFVASKCRYLLWLAVEHVISFARCPSMTRLHQTELFLDATVSCAQNSSKLLCDAFGAVMSFSQNSLRDGRTNGRSNRCRRKNVARIRRRVEENALALPLAFPSNNAQCTGSTERTQR